MRSFRICFIVFILLGFMATSFAQKGIVTSVTQNNKKIEIAYELSGSYKCFVEVFYSENNGLSWVGPLTYVRGDVGQNVLPGENKEIIWDAAAEVEELKGNILFKLETEGIEKVPEVLVNSSLGAKELIKNHKRGQKVFFASTMIAGVGGGLALLKSEDLYRSYKTATNGATKLHTQIQTYDIIAYSAFGVAGICLIGTLSKYSKVTELKESLNIGYVPLKQGVGLQLTYTF